MADTLSVNPLSSFAGERVVVRLNDSRLRELVGLTTTPSPALLGRGYYSF